MYFPDLPRWRIYTTRILGTFSSAFPGMLFLRILVCILSEVVSWFRPFAFHEAIAKHSICEHEAIARNCPRMFARYVEDMDDDAILLSDDDSASWENVDAPR